MKKEDVKQTVQVINKKHSTVETVLALCKLRKDDGTWVEGVVYHGMDRFTNTPMVFCRDLESFVKDFELLVERV